MVTESLKAMQIEESRPKARPGAFHSTAENWWAWKENDWCWHYDTKRWWKRFDGEWFTKYYHSTDNYGSDNYIYVWYSWTQWQIPKDPKYQ